MTALYKYILTHIRWQVVEKDERYEETDKNNKNGTKITLSTKYNSHFCDGI